MHLTIGPPFGDPEEVTAAALPEDCVGELDRMAADLGCSRAEFASLILVGWGRRRYERRVQEEARR